MEYNTGVAGDYHILVGDGALEMSWNTSGTFLRNGVHVNGTRYVQNDGSAIGTNTWHYCGITYTNYTKNNVGKHSHIKRIRVENFMCNISINKTNEYYKKLSELGCGREILIFLQKK